MATNFRDMVHSCQMLNQRKDPHPSAPSEDPHWGGSQNEEGGVSIPPRNWQALVVSLDSRYFPLGQWECLECPEAFHFDPALLEDVSEDYSVHRAYLTSIEGKGEGAYRRAYSTSLIYDVRRHEVQ